MNNAFFGKTMENVRDRTNLEFIDHSQIDQIIKRQSKLSFKGIVDHYSKFSVYKFDKEKTVFDKPIYLGFTVLELSKLLMYEFYYNKLQPYWKQSIQLHYMDTDSLILSFDTNHQELINFLQENKDEFDFSELDKSHELYNPINKKVIGKLKIETSPVLIHSQHYDQSHILLVTIIFKKRNKKEYKKLPNVNTTKNHCLIQKHQVLQIYQLDLIYTTLQLKNKTN